VDDATALAWGGLAAEATETGRPLSVVDGLLLATAARHDLALVTRNERDCRDRGVPVLNPWS
jgi:toxin FitB